MPTYVYGCPLERDHPVREVKHGFDDDPAVKCGTCHTTMERIPQVFRYYMNPVDVMNDWFDEGYRNYRQRREHAHQGRA